MAFSYLNGLSFLGIFGLCFIAWLFSENRRMRVQPWRTVFTGIALQLILGAAVFLFPPTRLGLQGFSDLLNIVFEAADSGARFVFGNNIVPEPGQTPNVNIGYIFAFRALPTVIFFSGLMALLYNIGVIQLITNIFAKIFYAVMRLSGAESLSGAANIFVGIEAAIVVKPFLAKMTRSELCAILSCCFGTAASSVLAIYVSALKPVFPNILGHLVSASIMAIPACFVVSKILVPETERPLTMGGLPKEPKASKLRSPTSRKELVEDAKQIPMAEVPATDEDENLARILRGEAPLGDEAPRSRQVDADFDDADYPAPPQETVAGEPIERMSPLDAAIVGALDGVKMSVSIAAVLILILGFVFIIKKVFPFYETVLGVLFLPMTFMTGVSDNWDELWRSSVIIGRRLIETAIPPYNAVGKLAGEGLLSPRAMLIISYALSGFAHLASVGIFVGGTIALIPSRRKDISELGWKALFAGTLATMMIGAVSGVFYTPSNDSILGTPEAPPAQVSPAPSPSAPPSPAASPTPAAPAVSPAPAASPTPAAPVAPPAPAASPAPRTSPR